MKLHEVTDINEGPLDIFRRSGNQPVGTNMRGAAGTSHEGFTFTGTKRGGARITMPNGRTKTISSQSPAEVEKIVKNCEAIIISSPSFTHFTYLKYFSKKMD